MTKTEAASQYQPGDLVRIRKPSARFGKSAAFAVHGVNKRGVQVRCGGTDDKPEWVAVDPRRLEPVHDQEPVPEVSP